MDPLTKHVIEGTATRSHGFTVDDIMRIIDHCRAAGIRSFVYRDLQFSFEGNKAGNASEVLRNPALRSLLNGSERIG